MRKITETHTGEIISDTEIMPKKLPDKLDPVKQTTEQMTALSTAHISRSTEFAIRCGLFNRFLYASGDSCYIFDVDKKLLDSHQIDDEIPDDLLLLLQFAAKAGSYFLCLDPEATELEELPVYDW